AATGLTNFVFKGGPGNDQLTMASANYTTPGSSTGISFQGGGGNNTFVGSADVNFTLADSGVTSSAGGTIQFSQVEAADLTGGASNNTLDLSRWTGTGSLPGGGGPPRPGVGTAGAPLSPLPPHLPATPRRATS